MVYHEVRLRKGTKHNYLIHNERKNNKWKKHSKYLGKGNIPKPKLLLEIKKFKKEILEDAYYLFLKPSEVSFIEDLKTKFNKYLLLSGKSGIQSFKEWFFTEITYNSNAIEGNTLSLEETSAIINDGLTPKGATLRELNEAKNHKTAINFLESYKGDLNEKLILKIHSLILKDIDSKNAGKYRKIQVFIRGTKFTPPKPEKVLGQMQELIKWYKKNKKDYHPLELATILSMKFVTIHPFVDGNGRVSRLLMNFLLKKQNYPEINILFRDRYDYLKCVKEANEERYTPIIEFCIKTLKTNYAFLYDSKKASAD